jgi:hypothetical protein
MFFQLIIYAMELIGWNKQVRESISIFQGLVFGHLVAACSDLSHCCKTRSVSITFLGIIAGDLQTINGLCGFYFLLSRHFQSAAYLSLSLSLSLLVQSPITVRHRLQWVENWQ